MLLPVAITFMLLDLRRLCSITGSAVGLQPAKETLRPSPVKMDTRLLVTSTFPGYLLCIAWQLFVKSLQRPLPEQ